MTDAERIEELEQKLAFLEDAHNRLDDVVRDQQQRLSHLEELVKKLTEEYRELRDSIADQSENTPPPHY